jgi:Zn-dependent peptidase ImmA (M78 family)
VAVSQVAENPLKTMLHELAHVVLGHTEVSECADAGELTRAEREVEAEGCA